MTMDNDKKIIGINGHSSASEIPHPFPILDLKPYPNVGICAWYVMIPLLWRFLTFRDTSFDNDHVWKKKWYVIMPCHKHRIVADCSPRYWTANSSSAFSSEILSGVSFTLGVMKVDQDWIDESPPDGTVKTVLRTKTIHAKKTGVF